MPLAPGTQLGRYEIREILGAGGMGEVYRAHDAGLQRQVAMFFPRHSRPTPIGCDGSSKKRLRPRP